MPTCTNTASCQHVPAIPQVVNRDMSIAVLRQFVEQKKLEKENGTAPGSKHRVRGGVLTNSNAAPDKVCTRYQKKLPFMPLVFTELLHSPSCHCIYTAVLHNLTQALDLHKLGAPSKTTQHRTRSQFLQNIVDKTFAFAMTGSSTLGLVYQDTLPVVHGMVETFHGSFVKCLSCKTMLHLRASG